MTEQELAEIERLASEAIQGPWDTFGTMASTCIHIKGDVEPGALGEFVRREDAEFAAASRTAVPALVAEIRWLSAIRDASIEARSAEAALKDALHKGDTFAAMRLAVSLEETCRKRDAALDAYEQRTRKDGGA